MRYSTFSTLLPVLALTSAVSGRELEPRGKQPHRRHGNLTSRDASDRDFTLNALPKTWQQGQAGTNQCTKWGASSPDSMCQNNFINAADDFCIFAPPTPGPDSVIGNTERIEVSWCTKDGYGTRLIPEGTITAAHFIKTKNYVQITGTGDLTKINVPAGDGGGELDPHGADGNGNPIGGLVFTTALSSDGETYQQVHEWMQFVAFNEFCMRACKGKSATAQANCQHVYDTMGCDWVMPGNYQPGFDSCDGDVGPAPGVYGTSTFMQGDAVTPSAHPAPKSSNCSPVSSIVPGDTTFPTGANQVKAPIATTSASSSSSVAPSSSSSSSSSTAVTSTSLNRIYDNAAPTLSANSNAINYNAQTASTSGGIATSGKPLLGLSMGASAIVFAFAYLV